MTEFNWTERQLLDENSELMYQYLKKYVLSKGRREPKPLKEQLKWQPRK